MSGSGLFLQSTLQLYKVGQGRMLQPPWANPREGGGHVRRAHHWHNSCNAYTDTLAQCHVHRFDVDWFIRVVAFANCHVMLTQKSSYLGIQGYAFGLVPLSQRSHWLIVCTSSEYTRDVSATLLAFCPFMSYYVYLQPAHLQSRFRWSEFVDPNWSLVCSLFSKRHQKMPSGTTHTKDKVHALQVILN